MAFTQSDLDALDKAIASGVRSATIGDETVVYNSFDEMIRARDRVAVALGAVASPGSPARPRFSLATFGNS